MLNAAGACKGMKALAKLKRTDCMIVVVAPSHYCFVLDLAMVRE
jgi:hypothetical protein